MTIYVADVNIIASVNARRFLAGIACATGQRIGVTPQIVESAAGAVARETVRREAQRLRRFPGGRMPEPEDRERLAQWFRDYARDSAGPFKLVCASREEQKRAVAVLGTLPENAFCDSRRDAMESDRQILAESLAGGADMVLTNNMRSIRHGVINEWYAHTCGRNDSLVVPADPGMQRLAQELDVDDRTFALAALAMTVSNTPRPPAEEWRGVAEMLHFAGMALGYPAHQAGNAMLTVPESVRLPMLAEARSLKHQQPWKRCREAEAARVAIVRGPPSRGGLEL